jgi:hypothetical protein
MMSEVEFIITLLSDVVNCTLPAIVYLMPVSGSFCSCCPFGPVVLDCQSGLRFCQGSILEFCIFCWCLETLFFLSMWERQED